MLSRVHLFQVVYFTNMVRVTRILAQSVNLYTVAQSDNMASGFQSERNLFVHTILL